MNKSAIVGTKPHGAITGAIAGHHDVGRYAIVLLIDERCLASGTVITDDTTVIGTEPVIASGINGGGVNVAQLKGIESKEFLDVLVQTVAVAGYPHVTGLVEHEFLLSILADRCSIELIVDKVLNLLILGIDNEDTLVVGGKPYPSALVHTYVPSLHAIGQRGYTETGQIGIKVLVPNLVLLVEYKDIARGEHPVVAVLVDIAIVALIGLAAIVLHEVVLPQHLTVLAIDSHQIAITGGNEQLVVPLGKVGEVVILRYQIVFVAVLNQLVCLLTGIVAVKALIVGLNPETLMRVDIETVDTTLDAPLGKNGGGIAVNLLGNGIEHAVVHTLFEPQLTIAVLPYLVNVIIAQSSGIARIRVISAEAIAIVAVESIAGAYPDESARILEHIVDLRVGQSIACVQPAEFHIGNHCCSCTRCEADKTDERG